MTDIVISYKQDDKGAVAGLAEKLRALRFAVWFDEAIPVGSSYDFEIKKQFDLASCVLVCWTPQALASDYVRAEAMVGRERKILAACMLRATPELTETPPFNLIQYADLTDWRGEDNHAGWRKLIQRIGELTSRPGLPEYVDLLAQRGSEPAALAAWKRQYPADPLAKADWRATKARVAKARKIARRRSGGGRGALSAVAALLLVGLTAAVGALGWWYGWGGVLQPGEQRVLQPFDEAGLSAGVIDANDMATREAGFGAAVAADARKWAAAAEAGVAGPGPALTPLAPDAAARLCRASGAGATARTAPSDPRLAVIVCANATRFAGQLDLAAGAGAGQLSFPAGDGDYVYEGEFAGFEPNGRGAETVKGAAAFAGQFRNGLAHGVGVFTRDGLLIYKGEANAHRFHGQGVLWSPDGRVRRVGRFCRDEWSAVPCPEAADRSASPAG